MNFESYIKSPAFLLFQDENLRMRANAAVENFLAKNDPVDKRQLHAIPGAILAGGLGELQKLAGQQRQKNTNTKIKALWDAIYQLIGNESKLAESLTDSVRSELTGRGYIQETDGIQEKSQKSAVKKANKDRLEAAMGAALAVYFEHFTCHYFYKTRPDRRAR